MMAATDCPFVPSNLLNSIDSDLSVTVVLGCGYVVLVTGACLAEAGQDVVCIDVDAERIAQLQSGGVPIYEHHLDVLESASESGKISYIANAGEAIRASDAIFISVGTPPKENGDADLSVIDNVARQIATQAGSSKLVIEKNTVPARTGLQLRRALNAYSRNSGLTFRVVPIPNPFAKAPRLRISFIPIALS
jgi:UDPglucose 6-dehydrogenase